VTQGEVPFRNFAQVELQTQGLENLVERWRFLAFPAKSIPKSLNKDSM
jgi:hypothetical protein